MNSIEQKQMRDMNEALIRSSVHQQELTEQADKARDRAESLASSLRKSEQRYRMLFDLGPVAVYSCDTSGVIQEFNRHAAELWGRTPKSGDTDELFCGSFKMFRADGTYMPHDNAPWPRC